MREIIQAVAFHFGPVLKQSKAERLINDLLSIAAPRRRAAVAKMHQSGDALGPQGLQPAGHRINTRGHAPFVIDGLHLPALPNVTQNLVRKGPTRAKKPGHPGDQGRGTGGQHADLCITLG